MQFSFHKKDTGIGVIIISGSCYIPEMAPFDKQAKHIVEQAISEIDIIAQVKIIPASTAFFGGVPKEVMAKIIAEFNQSGILLKT